MTPIIRYSLFDIRHSRCSRAFSLIEMMIAIVILGLGLVMVATMFPVAWDRARTLSEHTTEQSIAAAAHSRISSTLRPAGIHLAPKTNPDDSLPSEPPYVIAQISGGSFAGDLLYDQTLAQLPLVETPGYLDDDDESFRGIIPAYCVGPFLFYSDTRVHALNMSNMLVRDLTETVENPWDLEWIFNPIGVGENVHPCDPDGGAGWAPNLSIDFVQRSFFQSQLRLEDRVYPTIGKRPEDTPSNDQARNAWNDRFLQRKYSFAVLHRLRDRVGPVAPTNLTGLTAEQSDSLAKAAYRAAGSTRNLDLYYVSLRRSQSTHRFALQDPQRDLTPNPFRLDFNTLPIPKALPDDGNVRNDVVLPVAWRLQILLPGTSLFGPDVKLPLRTQPDTPNPDFPPPTGVPTEVTVPAGAMPETDSALIVSAFPNGTVMIDEITGAIYRVVKRRVLIDGNNQRAILTLDREIALEDIDLPLNDRRCDICEPVQAVTTPYHSADPEELRRTMWVFPPPVNRADPNNPVFEGSSPVIGVQVYTLSVAPPT